ncbi:hypothetical protein NMY22_g14387 [Coprinellus aureogranulatus]|nr:hypothetical protein NMY22_g14387 [Coprinellus aureogranulatus]
MLSAQTTRCSHPTIMYNMDLILFQGFPMVCHLEHRLRYCSLVYPWTVDLYAMEGHIYSKLLAMGDREKLKVLV